ncbi:MULTISPECIES: DUF948 domain-containing protein [Clostridia]|uniref:DUF948 domain-containing protein n=1 Tax=Clostridia TaxID=186801 RepID=UPI000EA2881E|nr:MULTISPECIES: DUF948 domain-containing protein [Clostridia]NBJ69041.1 DUF948 domain-containing protein [Roseburia sp. 1XD42-34]RKI79942.1 DUF948 domain-containing protein [Clostridium sp. 1xD42-85]
MEILAYIAAAIAAVAFVVLVVYLVITLKAARQTLHNVAETLTSLEQQMQGVTSETTQLLAKTNKLADDMNQKSSKLNSLFNGFKGIGDTVTEFNQSLRDLTNSVAKAANEDPEKTTQAIKWGTTLMELWKKKNK